MTNAHPPRPYPVSSRVFGALSRVRPEERRLAMGAFLILFGFMAGHALLETARDALFLSRWPASQLPWVYLGIAIGALALSRSEPAAFRRFSRRNELSAWLLFASAGTLALWILVVSGGLWVSYVLYIWAGVLATLVVVRFWTVLSGMFTVTQAKRLFAAVGSGAVLGAIVGSALARLLTAVLPASHLVLGAAVVFLIASLAPRLLVQGPGTEMRAARAVEWDLAETARAIWARPYLRRVAAMILLATITFTLVDFVFKSTVDRTVAPEDFGRFFASVYLVLNVVSLLVQIAAVLGLVQRLGVNTIQAVAPVVLIGFSVGYVAAGTLLAALLLKGADGSLRYSLYRTGAELLFVPVPAEVRARAKPLIDTIGQRGGQALASLGILLVLTVTTREAVFAGLATLSAGAWLFIAVGLRPHYLEVFREVLREDITETKIAFPALDVASLETLLSTLNEADDRRVIAALDLLAGQNKAHVIPGLILYHPSPRVVVHALELFVRAGRDDILPIVDRLRGTAIPEIAAASLRVRAVLRPERQVLEEGQRHDAPEVRATGTVALASGGWASGPETVSRLAPELATGRSAQLAMLRAVHAFPNTVFTDQVIGLAESDDLEVQLAAVRAMGEVKSPEFFEPLLSLTARRPLRREARAALVSGGPAALARLADAMGDGQRAHGIRRHLPAAIGAFGSPEAARILTSRLVDEPDGMIRFKILRALGRLRTQQPELRLDAEWLRKGTQHTLSAAFNFMRWRHDLERGREDRPARRTPASDMLVALLRDKQAHATERLFRLLNLMSDGEEFARIHRGLQSPKREARAGSRELIEHLVPAPVREQFLILVDDLYEPAAAGAASQHDADRSPSSYDDVLRDLLNSSVESLAMFAAYHAAELGLRHLRSDIAAQRKATSAFDEVARWAAAALGGRRG